MPPPTTTTKPPVRAAARAARSAKQKTPTPTTATTAPTARTSVMATWPKWKRYSVTGLFATVIISGTIWGASIKMRQEVKAESRKILEATVDEKVLILEQRKEYLNKQKNEIQSKIDDLHARMKARESGLSGR